MCMCERVLCICVHAWVCILCVCVCALWERIVYMCTCSCVHTNKRTHGECKTGGWGLAWRLVQQFRGVTGKTGELV